MLKQTKDNELPLRQQVAVVHNGIVENFLELKRDLLDRDHQFSSETSSKVIAQLIEKGLSPGNCFEEVRGQYFSS